MADCGICLEEVEHEVRLTCKHKLGLSCYHKWVEEDETDTKEVINPAKILSCPLCRRLYLKPCNNNIYLEATRHLNYTKYYW